MTEGTVEAHPHGPVDRARVLSFVGLVIGRLGPRAHGAVAGLFLALLVAQRTKSLFLVTVALTGHRLVSWITYPLIGRWSDRADTRVGRRTAYMALGLAVAAVCTFLYVRVDGFWALCLLIAVGRQALVVYRLPSIAQTPEIFGGSRWIRAAVTIGGGGLIVGLSIRLTVIATWERNDPSTWVPAYTLAAVYIAIAAIAVLLLVREAPASREVRRTDIAPWRDRIREVLAVPNGRVLMLALFVSIAGGGFTDRAYPIYAQEVLGAGADSLAVASLIAGPIGLVTSIPVGYWLSRVLTRKQIAIWATFGGALYAFAHVFITKLWQSVALGVVGGPLIVAIVIALAPLALQLFPRSGGLAERLGLFAGPIALTGLLASYASALTYDHLVHDYRVIWVFAGVAGLIGTVVMFWLRVPEGQDHTDIRAMIREIRSVFAGKGGGGMFRGEVTKEDADSVALVEIIQRQLDPYATFERPEIAPLREAIFGGEDPDLED